MSEPSKRKQRRKSSFGHMDPDYLDEKNTIALDVKDSTWEEAIQIIEKPPSRYAAYSALMVSKTYTVVYKFHVSI